MEGSKQGDDIVLNTQISSLKIADDVKRSADGYRAQKPSFATKAIHEAQNPDQWESRPITLPIIMSTSFKPIPPNKLSGYSRHSNPTRNTLEQVLASLEGVKFASAFSSGMGAISTVFNLLNAGDHVVTTADLYAGTDIYLKKIADRLNITTTFIKDPTEPINYEVALQANTKMVWIETPTNPTMKLVDIEAVSQLVHRKDPNIIVVVDNTYLSSYFQRPIELGADIVVHAVTKYLSGHGDVMMGCSMTDREDLYDRIRFLQGIIGAVPSPFECYLANRGIKTLEIRMQKHMKNGLDVARFLETHPAVERVLHPGLPSHPQHELSKRQCYGHSGMVTFFIRGASIEDCLSFVESLRIITYGSLASVESLVTLPFIAMPEVCGDTSLVRLSVGLEDAADIIEDLDQALKKITISSN